MPHYAWKGLQGDKYATGRVEAINREEAAFKVKQDKVIITSLTRISGKEQKSQDGEDKPERKFTIFSKRKARVPVKELVVFTKKLETMMRAGLPVLDTMKLIEDQVEHKGMKEVITRILNDVETGIPLSECFGKHTHVFDNIYIQLLKAGETSGKLDVFLSKLAIGIEKEQKIRSSIKGAMTYPLILLVVAIGVIAVMMIYVVPIFQDMFAGSGGLPGTTKLVIGISEFVRNPLGGGALVGTVVGIIILIKIIMKRSYKFRRLFHNLILKLPLFGELVQKSSLAKLSMVQGNLSSAGVPVLESLDICASAMSNIVIQEATNEVKRGVFSGEPLSKLYKQTPKIFPSTFHAMVAVGEQTGNMEEMFESISRYYEEEMDATIERLTSMLEPIMIVFLGGTIGFILVAMYTPMFQMGETF